MLIKLRVTPNSKVEKLQKTDSTSYRLKVTEKAIEGRANIAVIAALSSYFKVKKTNIRIVNGAAGETKQ